MTKPPVTDGALGARIRLRRKSIGITQADLANAIGVSFQQVQKYEKGISSISATRLQQICTTLQLPTTFFTDPDPSIIGKPAAGSSAEADGVSSDRDATEQFLESGEGRRLVGSFLNIGDPRLRTRVLEFIVAVAGDQPA